MLDNHVNMSIDAISKNESFARVVTAAFVTPLNPTVAEMTDIKTAVSEAVTNAIIHGYEGKPGKIYLEFKEINRMITITIKDFGVGIGDIKKAREPLYTSKPEQERSGMGFTVMETFMDRVEVTSGPGEGTSVQMMKYINDYQERVATHPANKQTHNT